MHKDDNTLIELAKKGDYEALESAWMDALETDSATVDSLIEVLTMVSKSKQADRAEVLAWTAVSALAEKLAPDKALPVARDMLLRAPGSTDLRKEVVNLYRKVYADHDALGRAIDLSALLSGGKVRKALKTLDICLHLKPGACILNRFDEQAAEIIQLDESTFQVVVRTKRGEQQFGPDQIAGDYDVIDADDFRALRQLHPEKVTQLLQDDPVALVIGMVRGHGNRMTSDELKVALCPAFLPRENWTKWWTKARTVLRKSPNVVLEGRNPIVLTYDAAGRTLEDEVWPIMEKTYHAHEMLEQLDGYLREAKSRKQKPSNEMLGRLAALLGDRIAKQIGRSPVDALASALLHERLANVVDIPDLETGAADILENADQPADLIAGLPAPALWRPALEHLEARRPDDWPRILGHLLERTPTALLDDVVDRLDKAGCLEYAFDLITKAQDDPVRFVDTLGWLWRGPKLAEKLPVPSLFSLLMRFLSAFDLMQRQPDSYPVELIRDARVRIRAVLSSKKFKFFEKAIDSIDSNMALTIHRQIERADGLRAGTGLDLRKIIDRKFPGVAVEPVERHKPWEDESVIYVTAAGYAAKERDLHELVHVKMKENAKAIGAAIEHGDLSENSEYKFALEERDLLQARMRQMQQEMAKARVLRPQDVSTDETSIGTKVALRNVESGDTLSISILGPWESDIDNGIYNYNAPLCKNLLGRKPGETVSLQLSESQTAYTIESIDLAEFE